MVDPAPPPRIEAEVQEVADDVVPLAPEDQEGDPDALTLRQQMSLLRLKVWRLLDKLWLDMIQVTKSQ